MVGAKLEILLAVALVIIGGLVSVLASVKNQKAPALPLQVAVMIACA